MRLSDAIAMGRVLIDFNPNTYLNNDATCGCALGMGLMAVYGRHPGSIFSAVSEQWPWTDNIYRTICEGGVFSGFPVPYRQEIGMKAFQVAAGQLTLDQLIDWVRSVEPVEENSVDKAPTEEVEYASMT